MVVNLHDWSKPGVAIGTDAFIHDPEHNVLRCPEGQTLPFRHLEAHRHQPVAMYRAPVAVCRACPRYAECVPRQDGGRTARRSIYQVVMQQHRDWMQTESAQAAARRRKGVTEGVIGTLKTQFGAGRAKGRGLPTVRAEWNLAAAAYNLKILHKALIGGYGPVLHQRVAAILG